MPGLKGVAGARRRGAGGIVDVLAACWTADVGDYVTALAWSPNGSTLAAAAANGPVFLLEAASGRALRVLAGHDGGTLAVGWSRDGRWVATGGQDGKARVWEADSGREVATLDGGAPWVEHVAWSPASDTLATAAGKHLKLWQAGGALLQSLAPLPSTITGIEWSADGSRLAASAYGGVRIWRLGREQRSEGAASGEQQPQVLASHAPLLALRWSPSGRYLACGCQDGSVHVWDAETAEDLEMTGYPLKVRELAWDGGGRYLATGGGSSAVVWDFAGKGPAGTQPKVLSAHAERITDLAFGGRRPVLVTGGQDGAAFYWDVAQPKLPLAAALEEAPVSRLAWQPGAARVAVGYGSGRVALWPWP